MDEKSEEVVKHRLSEARSSCGEGRGLVREWLPAVLIGFFLGQVEFGRKEKSTVDRAPGVPNHQRNVAWPLNCAHVARPDGTG
jgi:hypothetical protein